MIDKRKANLNMKKQWTKFIIVLVLYLLFLFWVKSWLGLIVVPFIFDVYITKKINWQWWKDSEKPIRVLMSWVDAIIFALVAVYFINLFFFQNYVIPSSSLEKSLLRGDYLFVSKLSYGPRIPQTPLTMPLTQHTLPVFGTKSYIEWPQWKYRRVSGLGHVELNDIVVFNYPAGDTVMSDERYQAQDYYQYCYAYGIQNTPSSTPVDSLTPQQRWTAGTDSANQGPYRVPRWQAEQRTRQCAVLLFRTSEADDPRCHPRGAGHHDGRHPEHEHERIYAAHTQGR